MVERAVVLFMFAFQYGCVVGACGLCTDSVVIILFHYEDDPSPGSLIFIHFNDDEVGD